MTGEGAVRASRSRAAGTRNPLIMVMGWELRRLRAGRLGLIVGATAFCGFAGIVWLRHQFVLSDTTSLLGTTVYGQLAVLVYDLMPVFGVLLPFVSADAVARDYPQRVHELLMSTAIPGWAYAGGRYLAALLVGLGLAVLLLGAQFAAGLGLALADPGFPVPGAGAALTFWAVLVLPATVTACSLSFSLGTLLPRYTAVTKLMACAAWLLLVLDLDPRDLSWRAYWNPTGGPLMTLLFAQLRKDVLQAVLPVASAAQKAQIALQRQQQMPDLSPWVGPYGTLVALSLMLVVMAALAFRRFRDVM